MHVMIRHAIMVKPCTKPSTTSTTSTINIINYFFGRIPMIFVSSIEKFAAIYTWPPWYFHISCWSQSIQLVWLCLCWQKWLVWTKLNALQYDNDLQSCSIFTTPSNSSLQFAVGGFRHLGAPNDRPMNAPACTKVLKILCEREIMYKHFGVEVTQETQVSEKHANYDELMINSQNVCMLSKHIQTCLNISKSLHHITSYYIILHSISHSIAVSRWHSPGAALGLRLHMKLQRPGSTCAVSKGRSKVQKQREELWRIRTWPTSQRHRRLKRF